MDFQEPEQVPVCHPDEQFWGLGSEDRRPSCPWGLGPSPSYVSVPDDPLSTSLPLSQSFPRVCPKPHPVFKGDPPTWGSGQGGGCSGLGRPLGVDLGQSYRGTGEWGLGQFRKGWSGGCVCRRGHLVYHVRQCVTVTGPSFPYRCTGHRRSSVPVSVKETGRTRGGQSSVSGLGSGDDRH